MNNNIALNFNIASNYLNSLSSPDIPTWHTACGPTTRTIKKIGINKHNRKTVEITWKFLNKCKEKGVQYTGKKHSKNIGRPYL